METNEKSCLNCKEYKKGDCGGIRLCDDYNPLPTLGKEDTKYWPTVMRSRSSYAGSGKSVYDWSPVKKKKSTKTNTITKKRCFNRISLGEIDSADALIHKFSNGVFLWISYESYANNRYKGIALFQYKGHTLNVETPSTESRPHRAILVGLLEATRHINKPCKVYVVTNTALSDNLDDQHQADFDLIQKLEAAFKDKSCDITEVLMKDSSDIIRSQIKSATI